MVWRCINRLEYGTKYCKESPTLEESRLHTAIVAALNCLAKLHLAGEDMPKDVSEAIRLFTLSAEQQNEFAAYQLGKLYLGGEDVPKDAKAAIRWLTASAEMGNQFSQYALGKLYFYDGDVPRDKEKSLYWLGLSAAQGNTAHRHCRDQRRA